MFRKQALMISRLINYYSVFKYVKYFQHALHMHTFTDWKAPEKQSETISPLGTPTIHYFHTQANVSKLFFVCHGCHRTGLIFTRDGTSTKIVFFFFYLNAQRKCDFCKSSPTVCVKHLNTSFVLTFLNWILDTFFSHSFM